MYRFALRPWWIVSHLVVVALVVTFVGLGFWQLRRLDERRADNTRLAERLEEPRVRLSDLLDDPDGAPEDEIKDRRVVVSGRYRPEEQVLIRGRSLDDGKVVAVNRGWIRNDGRFSAVPDRSRFPTGR